MKRNIRSSVLNAKMGALSSIAEGLHGQDSLDKRNTDGFKNLTDTISAVNDISDMFSGLFGVKAPYLTIGEIQQTDWLDSSTAGKYLSAAGLGGAVRAVQNLVYGTEQQGVIIDCLGDVSGETSVEFTSNPMMYITNGVIDSRIRQPARVNAVVGISNYLADDILGDLLNVGTRALGNLGGGIVNQLLNGGSTRAQAALYRLRWLMENGKPFTLYTPHGVYENMLIKSIKPRTTDATMDMLYADIEFQEVIMYTYYRNSVVDLQKSSIPARLSLSNANTGNATIMSKLGGWL